MKRLRSKFLVGLVCCMVPVSSVMCADIAGTVLDANGRAVQEARIVVEDLSGNVIAQGTTDAHGWYPIKGLSPGTYSYVLDPAKAGFQGGNGVGQLDPSGLRVNWTVSRTAPALSVGTQGSGEAALGVNGTGSATRAMADTGVLGYDLSRTQTKDDSKCDARPLPKDCQHPATHKK
jgi:Carboxypeptidase regulatory-like domain